MDKCNGYCNIMSITQLTTLNTEINHSTHQHPIQPAIQHHRFKNIYLKVMAAHLTTHRSNDEKMYNMNRTAAFLLFIALLRRTDSFPVRLFSASDHQRTKLVTVVLEAEQTTNEVAPVVKSRKKQKNNSQWIACSSTTEVTRAIEMYAQNGDVVAELGSQLRESSKAICEAIGPSGKAILVDVERKFPNEKKGEKRTLAMRREGDESEFYTDRATFVQIQSFEFWRDALFFRNGRQQYNVLIVDISTVAGNDLELTCISLVREFLALNHGSGVADNPCRAVILKSGSLHNLARRLHHAQRIVSGKDSIDCSRHSTSVIGAVGVKQYRETIPFVVRMGDVCVEVGCHLGTTTTKINEAAMGKERGYCFGVDVGSHIIKSARKKYPNLTFEVGDGFKTGALARLKKTIPAVEDESCDGVDRIFDIVYVDIGGLSGSEGLLEAVSLLSSIGNSLNPRCIVIKSLCIRRLASCLVAFSDVWRKEMSSKNKIDS